MDRIDKNSPSSLRRGSFAFGVVSGDLAARASLELLCVDVSRHTKLVVYPQILQSYAALNEQLSRGTLHVAWTPPLMTLDLEKTRLAIPVACSRRQHGTVYHSVLFTRPDLRIRAPSELAEKRVAWVDRTSLSGYLLPRQWLSAQGHEADRLFSTQQFLRTHSAVARAVLSGEVDAGATYANVDPRSGSLVDAGWFEIGAMKGSVDVLATIGPIPADAIVVSSRVSPEQRNAIVAALFDLSSSALGAVRVLFHADGFEKPGPSYFSALAKLKER